MSRSLAHMAKHFMKLLNFESSLCRTGTKWPDCATSDSHQSCSQLDLQAQLQVELCGNWLLVGVEEVDVAAVAAAAEAAASAGIGLPLLWPLPVPLSQGHSTVPDSLQFA